MSPAKCSDVYIYHIRGDSHPFPSYCGLTAGVPSNGGLDIYFWGRERWYSWEIQMEPGGDPQSSRAYAPQHSTAWELGVHSAL